MIKVVFQISRKRYRKIFDDLQVRKVLKKMQKNKNCSKKTELKDTSKDGADHHKSLTI